jgi:hypothetical protein
MNPEEYLDRLIERHEQGELYNPTINDEIALRMAAAESLAQLNEIQIPYSFAHNLELSIRDRARSLTNQNGWNSSLAESYDESATEQNGWNIAPVQSRSPVVPQKLCKHRVWVTFLRIAAVLIIAGVGVLSVSTRSMPGDALYSLNQAEKQFTLSFAVAPRNRATLQIDQLRSVLDDLNTVVKEGRDDDAIRLALNTVVAKTIDSQAAVAALPIGSVRGQVQQSLAKALSEEEQILRQLLNNVDWPMRLAFTQQLGALGDAVPAVTHAVVRTQNNGMLLITLTGSNFAPQAQLMVDGQQNGIVNQSSSTQLVAVSRNTGWSRGAYAVGVRNPDGTAAQLIINVNFENNSDQEDSNHNRHGTPVPYPTGGIDN